MCNWYMKGQIFIIKRTSFQSNFHIAAWNKNKLPISIYFLACFFCLLAKTSKKNVSSLFVFKWYMFTCIHGYWNQIKFPLHKVRWLRETTPHTLIWKSCLTTSGRLTCIHAKLFPTVKRRTCIHVLRHYSRNSYFGRHAISRSPAGHTWETPDKRHCKQRSSPLVL